MQRIASLEPVHHILRASDLDPSSLPTFSGDKPPLVVGDITYRALTALLPSLPASTLLVVPLAHADPAPDQVHVHARRAVCAGKLSPQARSALVENGVVWLGERMGLASEYRLLEEGLVGVQTVIAA